MRRKTELVVLCEDEQHAAFLRRFLKGVGWHPRKIRMINSPGGRGSAAQFVQTNFPKELKEYRHRRSRVSCKLAVMIDGDHRGVAGRLQDLDAACNSASVQPRQKDDEVAVFVPTWNIETWLTYLGGEAVDESRPNYQRLAKPRDCLNHAIALKDMCNRQDLRHPSPESLNIACCEYQDRL